MHLGDLDKNLQEKLEQERKKTEQIYEQELEKLKLNLLQKSQSVLSSILNDTELIREKNQRLRKLCLVLPGAISMSILIAFSIGSLGMMRSLGNQAQQIQQQKKTLENLKEQTWGIQLYQTQNGKSRTCQPRGATCSSDR